MTVAIGVDVGTTGAQAVAVDERGEVVASASSEYPLLTPRPLWTEQDPAAWWDGVRGVLGSTAREVSRGGRDVAGIGLTGQMHGSVFLDASGEVIRPALLWNDQRTAKQCAAITEAVGERRLVEITGNPALTGFQAPKVLWLRDEEPEAFARVRHVLLPKDYVRYRLAGEFATDASDAAGTLFLDLGRRTWSEEILDALGVPASWLPAVFESPEVAGTLAPDVAEALGLGARCLGGRHAVNPEPRLDALAKQVDKARRGGAGAEPQRHAVLEEGERVLRSLSLILVGRHSRLPDTLSPRLRSAW